MAAGRLADFRMVIRGRQRATHSDETAVSGRARELQERGFYVLRYHPGGSKPGDVWDIMPEDTQGRAGHFAPFPADLCRIPILATCPPGGVVLDPFCGTGTAMLVARQLGRRSVGIDLAEDYLEAARARCAAAPPPRLTRGSARHSPRPTRCTSMCRERRAAARRQQRKTGEADMPEGNVNAEIAHHLGEHGPHGAGDGRTRRRSRSWRSWRPCCWPSWPWQRP